jgi:hypothetical protein
VSSYISPTHPSQVVGYQSLPPHQLVDFIIPQQAPQMGAYPSMQQTSQCAQQGHYVQPQAYYPQLQQPQQPGRYPAKRPIGYVPQYDPQNQAQVVAQQYRMQQDQMQRQQIQQSGIQYKPNLQDNLRDSAAMVARAGAKYTVEDFLPKRR